MGRPTFLNTIDSPRSGKKLFVTLMVTISVCGFGTMAAQAQDKRVAVDDGRVTRHASEEWARVAPHLPDMETAPVEKLILTGDILRARRFPEDALDFYKQALRRGGDQAVLLNRIGVTELELQHIVLAQLNFKRVVKIKPKVADGWNNLGATEYLQRDYRKAISDYRKAARLDDGKASYRSNLGTAYFEVKNYKKARQQFEAALALDPEVFTRVGTSGVTAHILSPADRAHFYFEMAKVSLGHGDEGGALRWLEKAMESGFDVQRGVAEDPEFVRFRDDPRVDVLVRNELALKAKNTVAVVGLDQMSGQTGAAK